MKEFFYSIQTKKPISKKLFGLFFEDINFSIDGGINSNQINNPRFGFRYRTPKKDVHYLLRKLKKYRKKVRYQEVSDFFRYWQTEGAVSVSEQTEGAIGNRKKRYPLLRISGDAACYNLGYNGGAGVETHGQYLRDNAVCPAVGVKEHHNYLCSFYLKNHSYKGTLEAGVERDGELLTAREVILPATSGWSEIKLSLNAEKSGIGRFFLRFRGEGELCMDGFYFGDENSVGTDNPAWSAGKLRKDLVEALGELKPRFIRFPGGCIVEGYDTKNSYYWKNTVGNIFDRKPQLNLWGEGQADGGYMQSYEIGFYEYFLLCELLGAEPLPIINAGLACQGRSLEHYNAGEKGFQRYIDDALDLIEFANGDPLDNPWAKLRAEMGHPAPFGLKMLGIGNENWGEVYMKNFTAIKDTVKQKYKDIDIVWSAGWDCYKHKDYESRRKGFDGVHDDCIADDHFYRKPDWCIQNVNLYDDYDKKARIFLGEYAANTPWDGQSLPNNYYSALEEAAFMLQLERNGDKIVMSSYAPLFSRVGGEQWKHNLINFNSLYTLRTANFYVQKLYANYVGDYYIPCAPVTADGVFQSATTDGNRLYIKIVNINAAPERVKISLTDANVTASAKAYTLSCSDDYARNTLDFEGAPHEPIHPEEVAVRFVGGKTELEIPCRAFVVIILPLK